jgi:hypothetical protein
MVHRPGDTAADLPAIAQMCQLINAVAEHRMTALHVAEDACTPVPHRQVVLTIPKRLRLHTDPR